MRTVDVVKYREGGGLVTLILFTVAKGYSAGKTRGMVPGVMIWNAIPSV